MQTEFEVVSGLNHANIARVLEFNASAVYISQSGKRFEVSYIAMETLSNGELFDVLLGGEEIGEPLARVYFRQILEAVGYCHTAGVSHRNLKPENLLFDEHFNLKLTDFS